MSVTYQDCPITTAEWVRGGQGRAVWHLKNLQDVPYLDFLNFHGACIVIIEKNDTSSSKLRLKFFLREHIVEPQIGSGKSTWLSLCVSVDGEEQPMVPLQISVEVHELNGATMEVSHNHSKSIPVTISTKTERVNKVVVSQFLQISFTSIDEYGEESTTKISHADNYWFGVTATLFQYNGSDSGAIGRKPPSSELSLSRDFKVLYGASENFSDLKIQTKGKTVNAHAFIFAARSPKLRSLLEKETRKDDYKGMIKLDDISENAMRAILLWMYTGNLDENVGNVMEEVVEAATKYELYDLLKIMDQKLPSICNTENMFRLFQIAKGNCLPTAKVEISKFIKENIDHDDN